jgi:polyhydroxybutyrate depolymerase
LQSQRLAGKIEWPVADGTGEGKTMRGRRRNAIFVAGCLAGACWLIVSIAGLTSAALAAAGRVTVLSGGVPRTAIFVQHRRLKQARRPAIIVLRGSREKGGRLKRTFSLEEMARASGAVLVYPEPLSGHWEAAHGAGQSRDVLFIRDLINKLVARGIANRNKVFLVGAGTGGAMALQLACGEKNPIAGLAVIGASLPSSLEASCNLPRPIPLMMVADASDSAVPYYRATPAAAITKAELIPVEATLELFGKAAGCTGGAAQIMLPERELRHGTRAYLDKLSNCAVPVEAIRIERAPRPQAGPPVEAQSARGLLLSDVNARLVWDFLQPLGG